MKTRQWMLALLTCVPIVASAAPAPRAGPDLSYTLGEVRLLADDPDGRDDADGVRIGGSLLLQRDFFVTGGVSSLASGGSNGRDTDTFDLGLGLRHPLTSRVDVLGIAGLVHQHRSGPGNTGSRSDAGPSLTGGARMALTPAVEFGAFANYTEVFGDGDVSLRGEGLYHVNRNLSLLAGLGVSDEGRNANLGARWNF